MLDATNHHVAYVAWREYSILDPCTSTLVRYALAQLLQGIGSVNWDNEDRVLHLEALVAACLSGRDRGTIDG